MELEHEGSQQPLWRTPSTWLMWCLGLAAITGFVAFLVVVLAEASRTPPGDRGVMHALLMAVRASPVILVGIGMTIVRRTRTFGGFVCAAALGFCGGVWLGFLYAIRH